MSDPEQRPDPEPDVAALREEAKLPSRNLGRLLAVLLLLFVLPLIGAQVWIYQRAKDELVQTQLHGDLLRARTLAALVEREFVPARKLLESIAARRLFQQAWARRDFRALDRHLSDIIEFEPAFLFSSVYELDGRMRAIHPPDPIVGKNYSHRDWYKGVTSNWQPYISEVYRTDAAPRPLVVALAVPIRNAAGEPAGILMAPYALEVLQQKFEKLEAGSRGEFHVVDKRGILVAGPGATNQRDPVRAPNPELVDLVLAGQEAAWRTTLRGEDCLVGFAPIPKLGWAALYYQRADEALAAVARLREGGLTASVYLLVIYLLTAALAGVLLRRREKTLAATHALNEALERHVAELQRAQADLERSAAEIRDLYNHAPCGYHSLASDGTYLRINNTELDWLGYTREEVVGRKKITDFLTPDGLKFFGRNFPILKERGSLRELEFEMVRKDGTRFPVLLNVTAVRDATGEFLMTRSTIFDITDRKQVEEKLNSFFNLSLDLLCIAGFDGSFKRLNPAWEQTLGYTAEELQARPYLEFIHPDDRAATADEARRLAGGEKTIAFENRYLHKDGSYRWMAWRAMPVLGEKLIYATARDITERKKVEEELRRAEQQLQRLIESAPSAMVMVDREGRILLVNSQLERIFGYRREEILGQSVELLLPEPLREVHRRHRAGYLVAPVSRAMGAKLELLGQRKDGSQVPVDVGLSPLEVDGQVAVVAAITDITVRKQAEGALRRAKEEAERLSRFKDQFLSTMSHELRTPLNAVLGFSELLTDARYGPLTERQRRYLDHIHTAGQHLLRLINDILDLSKIEAGRIELAIEEVPVATACAEVLDALRPLAEKKSQNLCLDAPAGLLARADATRTKQVLMNLVGNAIKFTPEGGNIQVAARSAAGGEVRIDVRDTGPGIPPEEQQRIFDAFYRLRNPGQAIEGTGLGLAITQRLVELQGGRLGLESEPGRGSCFYFHLPAAQPPQIAAGPAEHAAVSADAPRVLVVEDDQMAAHLIESQLEPAGYRVALCLESARAVEMAAELRPDAITLDLIMKPVNGWEILAKLKEDARTAAIPVVVVSIVDQPGLGFALGADEYLVKPVEKSLLLSAVARALAARGVIGPERPILVVEDDAATREFVAEKLRAVGYAVATAGDGDEARRYVANSLPALVILDLRLPRVNGFELLAEWRADPRTAAVPVFVLTAKDLSREEEDFLRGHAESLFRKQQPWQAALTAQLRRVLQPANLPAGTPARPEVGV